MVKNERNFLIDVPLSPRIANSIAQIFLHKDFYTFIYFTQPN